MRRIVHFCRFHYRFIGLQDSDIKVFFCTIILPFAFFFRFICRFIFRRTVVRSSTAAAPAPASGARWAVDPALAAWGAATIWVRPSSPAGPAVLGRPGPGMDIGTLGRTCPGSRGSACPDPRCADSPCPGRCRARCARMRAAGERQAAHHAPLRDGTRPLPTAPPRRPGVSSVGSTGMARLGRRRPQRSGPPGSGRFIPSVRPSPAPRKAGELQRVSKPRSSIQADVGGGHDLGPAGTLAVEELR